MGNTVLIAFEVERGKVCIIDKEGERIPLFPARRVHRDERFSESLRQAIITVMSDGLEKR
jgi:hypothetical protein